MLIRENVVMPNTQTGVLPLLLCSAVPYFACRRDCLHQALPSKYWYNSQFEFMRKLFLWNYLEGRAYMEKRRARHSRHLTAMGSPPTSHSNMRCNKTKLNRITTKYRQSPPKTSENKQKTFEDVGTRNTRVNGHERIVPSNMRDSPQEPSRQCRAT